MHSVDNDLSSGRRHSLLPWWVCLLVGRNEKVFLVTISLFITCKRGQYVCRSLWMLLRVHMQRDATLPASNLGIFKDRGNSWRARLLGLCLNVNSNNICYLDGCWLCAHIFVLHQKYNKTIKCLPRPL